MLVDLFDGAEALDGAGGGLDEGGGGLSRVAWNLRVMRHCFRLGILSFSGLRQSLCLDSRTIFEAGGGRQRSGYGKTVGVFISIVGYPSSQFLDGEGFVSSSLSGCRYSCFELCFESHPGRRVIRWIWRDNPKLSPKFSFDLCCCNFTTDFSDSKPRKGCSPRDSRVNSTLITDIFNPAEATEILRIPIARIDQDDLLVWCGEHTGQYSVRSGYRSLYSSDPPNDEDRDVYKREDCLHVIRDCPFAKQVWSLLGYHFSTHSLQLDMSAWFAALFKFYDKFSHREILITFWGLWTARNKFLFEGLSQRPDDVATFVRRYCREMQILQDRMKSGISRSTEWIAPNFPFVKINYDSSFRQDVFQLAQLKLRLLSMVSNLLLTLDFTMSFLKEILWRLQQDSNRKKKIFLRLVRLFGMQNIFLEALLRAGSSSPIGKEIKLHMLWREEDPTLLTNLFGLTKSMIILQLWPRRREEVFYLPKRMSTQLPILRIYMIHLCDPLMFASPDF
ncbi:hypothetical protein V6N11_036228 [Hibiscus sabdariffa]|uniref:Reverse transcriptase zinc-binding domain-containing protein n=1 Tax=Hibiscus sabdariffa TaxID=183260 RepID=A0ABR2RA91_9ROSI